MNTKQKGKNMSAQMKEKSVEFKIITDVKNEPTLSEAQKFVGGYVEGIEFPNGDYLIVNEMGKLKGLPNNEAGTKLWRETFTKDKFITGTDDWVCGNALYIKAKARKLWV
jgi:hypothetical protein|tara:strand:+ start:195 stop:524 length:330 start_codon:yes stop_codon:yes gene_type:complete